MWRKVTTSPPITPPCCEPRLERFADDSLRFINVYHGEVQEEAQGLQVDYNDVSDGALEEYLINPFQNNDSLEEQRLNDTIEHLFSRGGTSNQQQMSYRDARNDSYMRAVTARPILPSNPYVGRAVPPYPSYAESRTRRLRSQPHSVSRRSSTDESRMRRTLSPVVENLAPLDGPTNPAGSTSITQDSISDESKRRKSDINSEILARRHASLQEKTDAMTIRHKSDVVAQIKALNGKPSVDEENRRKSEGNDLRTRNAPNANVLNKSVDSARHNFTSYLDPSLRTLMNSSLNATYTQSNRPVSSHIYENFPPEPNENNPPPPSPPNSLFINQPSQAQSILLDSFAGTSCSDYHSYVRSQVREENPPDPTENKPPPPPNSLFTNQPSQAQSVLLDSFTGTSCSDYHSYLRSQVGEENPPYPTENKPPPPPNSLFVNQPSQAESVLLDSFTGTSCNEYHNYLRSQVGEKKSSLLTMSSNGSYTKLPFLNSTNGYSIQSSSPVHVNTTLNDTQNTSDDTNTIQQSPLNGTSDECQRGGGGRVMKITNGTYSKLPFINFTNGYSIQSSSPVHVNTTVNDTQNTSEDTNTIQQSPLNGTSDECQRDAGGRVIQITTEPVFINGLPLQSSNVLSKVMRDFNSRADKILKTDHEQFEEQINHMIQNSLSKLVDDMQLTERYIISQKAEQNK